MLQRITPVLALLALVLPIAILGPATPGASQGMAATPTWEYLMHVPSLFRFYGGLPPTATATITSGATPTPTATATNTSQVTPTPSSSPTATSTATAVPGVFINGDFEWGTGFGWQEWNNHGYPIIRPGAYLSPTIDPTSGDYLAALRTLELEPNEVSQLWQDVTFPDSVPLYLNFNYLIRSQELCDPFYWDLFEIYVNEELAFERWWCWDNDTNGAWWSYSIDASELAGRSVRITFVMSSLDAGWTTLHLDDISVDSAPRGAPTVTP